MLIPGAAVEDGSRPAEDRLAAMAGAGVITEETVEVDGIQTFLRRTRGTGAPTVFVHGNPTNSADWLPFLRELEGPAIALDLPNFGRSERLEPARFGAGMDAYADFLGAALDQLVPDRFNLVVHDWGGIALQPAQRRSDRLGCLVVINAVPLLPGYRWHFLGRLWRRRGVGELFNATASRAATAQLLRPARPGLKPMPREFVDMIWSGWDAGMRRAMLRLYRSADPGALEAAGAHLGSITAPALVVWGQADPYIGGEFGRRYAAALPGSELLELDDAGHWPWIDRPDVIARVTGFLAAASA